MIQLEQQMYNMELISIEIKPKKAKVLFLFSRYRFPTANVDNATFENPTAVLTSLDREDKETILIGDTNCDVKDKGDANTKKRPQVYLKFKMEELIETYTMVATNTSDNGPKIISRSLTDNFSTSKSRYIFKTDVVETGMVDCFLIYGTRKLNT